MTSFISAFLAIFMSSSAFAAVSGTTSIYGWDIQCKGAGNLSLSAAQSDDDFYVTYSSDEMAKNSVSARSDQQYDTANSVLAFTGSDFEFQVFRKPIHEFGYAWGEVTLEGVRHALNCYVRFYQNEEDVNVVKAMRIPLIRAPRN